jgi:hypothetical protein
MEELEREREGAIEREIKRGLISNAKKGLFFKLLLKNINLKTII